MIKDVKERNITGMNYKQQLKTGIDSVVLWRVGEYGMTVHPTTLYQLDCSIG